MTPLKLTANPQTVTVAANGQILVNLAEDYVRFDSLPTGLNVAVNEGTPAALAQGIILQGEPGAQQLTGLRFVNTTGGELSAIITTGQGRMTVAGVATLSGTVPLPTGASTAALQTTGNTSLSAIDTKLGTLDDLAATTTEIPDGEVLGASQNVNYANCKTFSVLNTNTGSENVTVTRSGSFGFALAPGQSVSWAVLKPLAVLTTINIVTTGSGSALVAYTK